MSTELPAVEEAMGEAAYLAERKLKEVLGDEAVVVVNVATPSFACGSFVHPDAPPMLADSLLESAEEVGAEAPTRVGRNNSERLKDAAEQAVAQIDGHMEFLLVSGLVEEGGGLPLYESSKGLAEARVQLAAALSASFLELRARGEDVAPDAEGLRDRLKAWAKEANR